MADRLLLFVTHSKTSGHRVEHYFPALEASGWSPGVHSIPADAAGRAELIDACRKSDAVIVHRRLPGAPLFRAIRDAARRLVFDFDDAVFYRSSRHRFRHSPARWWKFRRTVRAADHVTAGNHYLAGFARRMTDRVTVIPTAVDCTRFRPFPDVARDRDRFTVGWVGRGEVHLPYLKLLIEPLSRLAAERPVRLRLIGTRGSETMREAFVGVPFETEFVEWVPFEEIPAAIAGFDVGVMPLTDDPYARGKCALKAIEYMACGIPVVLSPVGVNAELIADGENGMLAADADAWTDRFRRLASDPLLGARLGAAGRRTVESGYSIESASANLLEVLRSLD